MIKLTNFPKIAFPVLAVLASLTAVQSAKALTINGTTAAKYLVSGSPVNSTSIGVLKISFQNKTSGTNLSLCAGTAAEFSTGTCGTELASSGGPGFTFLAIQDSSKLYGKLIYVIRNVGSVDSAFTIVIE